MFLSLVTIVLFSTAMMSLSLQQSTDNKVVENKFNTVMNIVSDAVTSVLSATWQLIGGDIDGEDQNNRSGSSVSLSGDGYTLAIGAIGNSANGNNSGHVRVYQYDGTDWFQKGGDIDGDAAFDQFGFSVSLSSDGNIVAIGGYGNSGNGSYAGHVRVYEYDGTDWVQNGGDIDGEAASDQSGYSVSLSSDGNIVAIGANRNNGIGPSSGHVRVYELPSTGTTELPSTAIPTIVPTEFPFTVTPTTTPTIELPIIIETPHPYTNSMNEKWVVNVPGMTCYKVTVDPQSWTPNEFDFVKIQGKTAGVKTPYPATQSKLYKLRLKEFGEMNINENTLIVTFNSDAFKVNYGFRMLIDKC